MERLRTDRIQGFRTFDALEAYRQAQALKDKTWIKSFIVQARKTSNTDIKV